MEPIKLTYDQLVVEYQSKLSEIMDQLLFKNAENKELVKIIEQQDKMLEEFNKLEEGLLPPSYEVVGTIIEEKGTFNILDSKGQRLLVKNYLSLKKLLNDLADNM